MHGRTGCAEGFAFGGYATGPKTMAVGYMVPLVAASDAISGANQALSSYMGLTCRAGGPHPPGTQPHLGGLAPEMADGPNKWAHSGAQFEPWYRLEQAAMRKNVPDGKQQSVATRAGEPREGLAKRPRIEE